MPRRSPSIPIIPRIPNFKAKFGPRGVIHSYAGGKIEDTGPLTKKRMETIDAEFLAATEDFIGRAHQANKPFFVWFNTSRMHIWTHLQKESEGKTGLGVYADGMVEHDDQIGQLLKKLDDLGLTSNTIVIYSTDNGAELMTWPDGGMIPFRGEKNTNWEGGYRVPMMVRWPGHIQPGQVSNVIISQEDWLPTLLAAAGEPDIKEKLLAGDKVGDKTFKVHLDGYNFLPYLTGQTKESPRKEFFYFSDDGQLVCPALRALEARLRRTAGSWPRCLAGSLRDARDSRSSSTCWATPSNARTMRPSTMRIGGSSMSSFSFRPRPMSGISSRHSGNTRPVRSPAASISTP